MKWSDWLAALTTAFWPLIPLFWLPLHLLPRVRKALGLFFYPLIVTLWLIIAYLVITRKIFAAAGVINLPAPVRVLGAVSLLAGLLLQVLTALYLGRRIIGLPHFRPSPANTLVTQGPFRLCRHPTYLAHSLIFFGTFFLSGYITVALVALLDLLVTQLLIIPLEERELHERLGKEYEAYCRKTPKMLPGFRL